jgi:hypothetical protein
MALYAVWFFDVATAYRIKLADLCTARLPRLIVHKCH